MASPMALAEQYWTAFSTGDTAKLNDIINDDISFEGPMVQLSGRESFMQAMTGMAQTWKCSHEPIQRVEDGDTAVMLYDFVMTEPVKQTVRMTEWFRTRDGKLSEIKLLFDTAKFTSPADM